MNSDTPSSQNLPSGTDVSRGQKHIKNTSSKEEPISRASAPSALEVPQVNVSSSEGETNIRTLTALMQDTEKLANELFNNAAVYATELTSETHPLWAYLAQKGLSEMAEKYRDMIRTQGVDGLRSLCYALSRSIPFLFAYNKDSSETLFYIGSISELHRHLNEGRINQTNIEVLASPAFRTWLGQHAPDAIVKLQKTLEGVSAGNKQVGWLTAYLTCPNLDYYFREIEQLDKSECFTIEQLCTKVALQISNPTKYGNDLYQQWQSANFNSSRFCQYLISKDKYDKEVDYIRQELKVHVQDNTPKYGHYNQRVVRMKAVAGVLKGKFPLEIKNVVIHDLEEYQSKKESLNELTSDQDELLTDWLSLFFSEEPKVDYNKSPYKELVLNMINYMVTNCPNSKVTKNVLSYRSSLEEAKGSYQKNKMWVRITQWAAILVCFLPILGIFCISIYLMLTTDAEVTRGFLESIGTMASWAIGVIVGVWGISEIGLLPGLILGALAGGGTKALCVWAPSYIAWVWIALLAVILMIFAKKLFTKIPLSVKDKYSSMPLSQAECNGEIIAAFGRRSLLLANLPTDYPLCVYTNAVSNTKSSKNKLLKTSFIMLVVTLAVVGLSWYVVNKYNNYVADERIEVPDIIIGDVKGYYEGVVNATHATLVLTQTETPTGTILRGKIVTDQVPVLEQNVVGQFTSMDKKHLVLKVVNGDGKVDDLSQYNTTVEYGDKAIVLSGTYDNPRKKTNHSFTFTRKE